MLIIIKRRGVESARVNIERLVSTLGFGEDCDVSLAQDRDDLKLGMLIQQGDGLSFRPLKQDHQFFLGDVPVANMMPLAEGEWLSMEEFELSWINRQVSSIEIEQQEQAEFPPPQKPIAQANLANRAGAMMAYGQVQSPAPSNPHKSEESLELSQSAAEVALEKKEVSPPLLEPIAVPSEVELPSPKKGEQVKALANEQSLSPAEVDLMQKLKRLENVKKPSSLQLNPSIVSKSIKKNSWKETENDILGPSWKRVVKYFYHHIEMDVFQKKADEKLTYMKDFIQAALDATTNPDEQDIVRPRVERELSSASPFDRIGLSSDVQGIRVTDKGLLSMDRGHGFGAPEISFYNGAHVCWSFDRWLQSNGLDQRLFGADCHGLSLGVWTVNAFFKPLISNGFLIQLKKTPKILPSSLDWFKELDYKFADLQAEKRNMLVIAKDTSQWLQMFQLMQANLAEGQMLGILGEHLKFIKDNSKYLFLDKDQSLAQLLKVNESLGLYGLVDFELENRGKSIFKQTAFKDLSYWGFSQARHPLDALRRFELQWRLSSPQSDAQTIREWIQSSFSYVLHIVQNDERDCCIISPINLKNGDWFIPNHLEDEWD